ncbi:helicase c2 [Anaeromyxobacter dehalogenans 2CP-1]|uniref:Helicase c2 n=1 Tax=Anaeromyxobacter dehalogenans (strain ATCC BAA-258 / DSM 21875 / 2CP-1) TaxID=455488 RepID=B8JCS5_ANAD2|nr:ATP-dependent DNA helicase [Anaeromyxobacter dehalogenans]ACL67795.1 helicase c2 [Anaeromyxobacter dehalogenans 2CP-1]
MARAVERAIERRGYLVAEAGTGTGKTLAYLVPAVLSGRRVIVSTATKTLQEQLWQKDIPLLRDACGLEFGAAYLKGRSNYFCLARGEEFARAATFPAREEAALWPRIEAWARRTETGDRSEIDLPDQFHTWKDLSATSENCLGRECARYEECFVTRARALAAQADVLLVNHHLFFADLAMRTSRAGVEILPEHDVVIFDEAHAVEDVATEYFGLQVSSYRVEELSRDALRAVADRPDLASMMRETTGELRKAGERFFQAVADGLRQGGTPARGRGFGPPPRRRPARRDEEEGVKAALTPAVMDAAQRDLQRLDESLAGLRELLGDAVTPALSQIARRAGELRVEVAAVTAMKEPSRVYFGEVRGRGVFLRAAPIDVAEELRERLYQRTDTAVFTSATLAAQGRFDFFRRQVGLLPELEVEERRFEGPFDYARQAALVSPEGLPEPNDPGFVRAAAESIRALTAVTGGRAFVLCTSNRNMNAFHEACRDLPYQVLRQGDRPKSRLLDEFRSEPSVLFATASFWEGVDVPGEALSLVIIDRLPFAPPGDPVMSARLRALEEEGRDGFSELQVPAAALALRQGFGRLVRTREDRGLVAVLDRRLVTKGYGRAFLATLPRCPLLRTVEDARRWWLGG